jgi:hypothetical protein
LEVTVPDLFEPLPWNDGPGGGTPASVARGPRRWEAGIEALDVQGDSHDDQLVSLAAAMATFLGKVAVGVTADRPAPDRGVVYVDTDISALLVGIGTGWLKTDLTAVSGVAGGNNAPQNFAAVASASGGIQGSITLTWDAVAGAAASGGRGPYIIYEGQSLSGVTGATAVTGTSSVRTPSTPREYEYWVQAMVGGVESAASTHGKATLPVTGGGGTGSIASILDIGAGGSQNHFSVDYGPRGAPNISKPMADIVAGGSWTPYVIPNTAGDAVRLRSYADGGQTPTTAQARSEFRETNADGTKAVWDATSGSHVMEGTTTFTHLPADAEATGTARPWVCFAQIHDGPISDPTTKSGSDLIELQVRGTMTGGLSLAAIRHAPTSATALSTVTIDASYSVGDVINWKIECVNGTIKIYLDGVEITGARITGITSTDCYFKSGNYLQFNTADKGGYAGSSYAELELKSLNVTHS